VPKVTVTQPSDGFFPKNPIFLLSFLSSHAILFYMQAFNQRANSKARYNFLFSFVKGVKK